MLSQIQQTFCGEAVAASNLLFNRAAKKIAEVIAEVAYSRDGYLETFHEWSFNIQGQDRIFTILASVEMRGDNKWCTLLPHLDFLGQVIATQLREADMEDVTLTLDALASSGTYKDIAYLNWSVVE